MYLITRKDKIFTHIGIYLNDSSVLHYSSRTNNFFKNDKIVKHDTLSAFSRNRCVKLTKINKITSEEEVIKLSRRFNVEKKKYHIISNNCYTFVMWCLYQKSHTNLKDIFIFTRHYKIPIISFFGHLSKSEPSMFRQ